jgi:hypothetical protein
VVTRTKKLIDEALAIEDAESKLKSASVSKILAAFPAAKAAGYLQIESKIRAVVRYDLAASIPLVEERSSDASRHTVRAGSVLILTNRREPVTACG